VALIPDADAPDAPAMSVRATRFRRAADIARLTGRPNRAPLTHEPGKVGKPAHAVTPTQQRLVQHWTAVGLSQAKIAGLMGIAVCTLQKYYRYELDHGEEIANANVAANLYRIACSSAPSAAGAAQYWLNKRSEKFREAPRRVELTGKNGAPVAVASAQLTLDPRKLTAAQRDALREILTAASEDVVEDAVDENGELLMPTGEDGVDASSLDADDWPGDDADARRSVDDPAGDA